LPAQSDTETLPKLFADYHEDFLRDSPERATLAGLQNYNHRWRDLSTGGIEQRRKMFEAYLIRLRPFRGAALNEQDRISCRLLEWQLQNQLDGVDINSYYMAINHRVGPHLDVFIIFSLAPANTIRDYENLVSRLRALPVLVDQVIAAADAGLKRNLIPPRIVAALVVKQLDIQMAPDPLDSPLLAAFRKFPASIPLAEGERLRTSAVQAYSDSFMPAWKKLRAYVSETYMPRARETIGLSDMANGSSLYALLVKYHTTTNLTPEQIHELGLKEVARIEPQMAAIRKELRFEGSADEFVDKVLQAPEFLFKSKQEILAHAREIAKRIDPELPRLFKKLPRMPYGVQAIPADRERTTGPYYAPPSLNGTRGGNFFVGTYQPETQSKCCMEPMILHESVPGHHLQTALAQEMEGGPEFRKLLEVTAYSEGWGLYAETLGSDLGMYQDPYERYGRLQSEYLRALRLVADTGLHSLGWSRQKAIETISMAKGGRYTDSFIASEVDRYIADPAQALAYKVGGLRIQELRAMAEKELGPKFDVREFHDVVLRNGALPLGILEEQVLAYVKGAK
jgi:uncharacterized protein (DUF885 family)